MNLGTEVLHKKLYSKHVFHENQHSDNHTLFKGVNEFLPYFPYFLIGLGDVGYRRFTVNGVSTFEVCEHWCSSNHNLSMSVKEIFAYTFYIV